MKKDQYLATGSYVSVTGHNILLEVIDTIPAGIKVKTKSGKIALIDNSLLAGIYLTPEIMEIFCGNKENEGKNRVYYINGLFTIRERNTKIVLRKETVNNFEIETPCFEFDFVSDSSQGEEIQKFKFVHELQQQFGLTGDFMPKLEKVAFKPQEF